MVRTNRFRENVRTGTSGRDLHGLDTGTGQDRVEGGSELPGPVTDQKPEVRGAVTKVHQEVTDLLGSPRPVRVRSDSEDVHVARTGFDDEQAIQALERHRAIQVKEVRKKHRGGLRAQELPPVRVSLPFRRRRDLQGLQDTADRGSADPVAELAQLAPDPLVSPAAVLGGEPLDERAISALTGGRLVRCG